MLEAQNREAVAALVEQWDIAWGCGPWEESLPEAEELRRLNELTGRVWTAEEVRLACFEHSAHNSLEETVYFLFHGEYPPITNLELVFYRPRPGAVLEPEAVYEAYRLGRQLKALLPLPAGEITAALQALPGFRKHPWASAGMDSAPLCMDAVEQPAYWSDVCFHVFWFGGRHNPSPDHLLCLSCRNLSDAQIQALTGLLAEFGLPVQYREEDHAY